MAPEPGGGGGAIRTIDAGVVRLNVHALDFSVLGDDGVALRAFVAQDRGGVEEEVELAGEGARGVS